MSYLQTGRTLAVMTEEVRKVNIDHGWRTGQNTFGDYIALLHSELSEALEAYRDHRLEDATERNPYPPDSPLLPKPEGVGSEFADVLIRLLDTCDVYGIKLFDMDCGLADVDPVYAGSGAPSTFGGTIAWLHGRVAAMYPDTQDEPHHAAVFEAPMMLRALVGVAERYGIDLEAEYARKIAYNRTRPYQHGGRTLADAPGVEI
jgi:NTP pyrophosphatase (non-canonical NTP hydrolase)